MNDIANAVRQQQTQVNIEGPKVSLQPVQTKVQVEKPQNLVEDIQNASKPSTQVNSKAQMDNLIDDLNKAIAPMNTNLKFGVDPDDIFYVSVIESETSKMIRRFPAEKAADFLPKMLEVTGILFDTKG
ncbi:flagellar protein FlaG [Sulfurimonas sp. SAG-AH-194-I05]|nr:flagellar protein FlaG [Sulfurimonas sp. SAG-AH-194-I05]MDF1874576.1 flagellar protein FlaG [Sulfurimonas sp. SAG-AH-194-I05]